MCLWFKTSQKKSGMVSVTNANGNAHDRHMGLKNGKPYVRIWKGQGWQGNQTLNDNKWHHFCYTAITGQGQTMYIDGKKEATNA